MKMLSLSVVILGVVAMVLAFVAKVAGHDLVHVTGGGFLRGATALFLLAIALMIHERVYGAKPPA